MILTGRRFTQIGEALYGPRWANVLAEMVCCNNRLVRYYAKGRAIPVEFQQKLAIICRTRGHALLRIADELDNAA